jgi:phospholipid/cholesterol/gamma-HCH transport system permease protein
LRQVNVSGAVVCLMKAAPRKIRNSELDHASPLAWDVSGDRLTLRAAGPWTAGRAHNLEQIIGHLPDQGNGAKNLVVDMHGVSEFDTFGAWMLERILRESKQRGCVTQVVGLADRYRGLVQEIHLVNLEEPQGPVRDNRLLGGLEAIGRGVDRAVHEFSLLLELLGQVSAALLQIIAQPRKLRLTSLVYQLDRVGWRAVPIILLITFLIGGIIAQQGIFQLRRFAAEDYAVDLVGILVLREIGVLIVAIMVAGRSGSSYTAELGSMKMREEIDALRTMGRDPVEVLILPRIVALICALPILTLLGALAALAGGCFTAWIYAGMSPEIFIARLKDAISLTDFEVGMIKSPFMALVIGIVACSEGLQVKGSAESLGLRTTSSVVKSIFLVIVLDGFFAMFFASIGM